VDINKAIEIAVACVQVQMKDLRWKAHRYEQYPDAWKEYKAGYKRYKDMEQAIKTLESIQVQGKLF